jgi:hypothetical protein
MSLSTPVAFLIFNRPDTTRRVFEMIVKVKPKKLFVVADGPRFPQEAEKCAQARAVVNRVDWDCELFTDFADNNLGCGRRISSGIAWVFSQVEEAIFLEDDTLPTLSFFPYCQTLLEHYRHDNRIMAICGNNFQFGQRRTDYSYHFTKYGGIWGWASWRRAWRYYDYELKSWPEFKRTGLLESVCQDPYEQSFWTEVFNSLYEDPGIIDTWDHQWYYAWWTQNGLAIEPSVNLVSNIGFGRPDASHTLEQDPLLVELARTQDIEEINHPPFVVRHNKADAYLFDYVIGGQKMREKDSWLGRLRRQLRSAKKGLIPPQAIGVRPRISDM